MPQADLLLSTLEFQPFLVKPNREELSEMFRAPADTEEQVTALAEELKKRGAKNVLVSMAGDGALLYTETGEVYFAPAAKGTLINSTGAGRFHGRRLFGGIHAFRRFCKGTRHGHGGGRRNGVFRRHRGLSENYGGA